MSKFQALDPDEVININRGCQINIINPTFTVREFAEAIAKSLAEHSQHTKQACPVFTWNNNRAAWFTDEGVPGRVLQFGERGWQEGRVRVTIEFCPDEDEDEIVDVPLLESAEARSPLDEIREMSIDKPEIT